MSEVHMRVEAVFADVAVRSTVFRGFYSHAHEPRNHEAGLAEFQSLQLDARSVLSDEISWNLTEYGVDDAGKLYLSTFSGTSGYTVCEQIVILLDRAGAAGVFAVVYHDGVGSYQAITSRGGRVQTLYESYNYDEMGEDYFSSMKTILASVHPNLVRLNQAGLI